jgi:hypothetical protein
VVTLWLRVFVCVASLQSNRIAVIEGLETLVNLEELYLGHNAITKTTGLSTLVSRTSAQRNLPRRGASGASASFIPGMMLTTACVAEQATNSGPHSQPDQQA